MSSPRPTALLIIAALRRKTEAEGGMATIFGKGDKDAGGILLVLAEKGRNLALLERRTGLDGNRFWDAQWAENDANQPFPLEMLQLRRKSDPDLWIMELDVPDAERFAVEIASIC